VIHPTANISEQVNRKCPLVNTILQVSTPYTYTSLSNSQLPKFSRDTIQFCSPALTVYNSHGRADDAMYMYALPRRNVLSCSECWPWLFQLYHTLSRAIPAIPYIVQQRCLNKQKIWSPISAS